MTIRRDALLGFGPVAILAGVGLALAGLGIAWSGLWQMIERVGEAQDDT